MVGFFESQSTKPAHGGARLAGNRPVPAEAAFSFRWVSIFSITTGSSMQAITLTVPPHSRHVSMSILKTRFNRWAQVIDAQRSAGVGSCVSLGALVFLPLPRFAGRTRAGQSVKAFNPLSNEDHRIFKSLLSGANTINGFRNRDIRLRLANSPLLRSCGRCVRKQSTRFLDC